MNRKQCKHFVQYGNVVFVRGSCRAMPTTGVSLQILWQSPSLVGSIIYFVEEVPSQRLIDNRALQHPLTTTCMVSVGLDVVLLLRGPGWGLRGTKSSSQCFQLGQTNFQCYLILLLTCFGSSFPTVGCNGTRVVVEACFVQYIYIKYSM